MASPKHPSRDFSIASSRYRIFMLVMLLLGLLVIGRIIMIVYAQRDYWHVVALNNRYKVDTVQAQRGNIFSDEGEYLASYLPNYEITLDFKVIDKNEKQRQRYQNELDSAFSANIDSFALGLSRILGGTPREHKNYLVKKHAEGSQSCKLGGKRMSFIQRQQVRALPYFKNRRANRFAFKETILDGRTHPYGNLGLRTIGEIYAVKREAKSGIELGMNDYLKGKDGLTRLMKVGKQYVDSVIKPAVNGADVYTTLNMEIQDLCDQVLREQLLHDNPIWGSCMVMEVATGDIKAMVNLERKADGQYLEGPNRLVSNQLEPGSVMKPVSLLVALDDKHININSGYDLTGGVRSYSGRQMREHNYYSRGGYSGYRTLPFILGYSSNVGISGLIYQHYKNKPKAFVNGIARTGILDKFDIAIPGTARGHVSDPDSPKWSNTSLPWLSIGYESKVPPLACVAFYNGVANGGKMMRPRLVTKAVRGEEVLYDNPVSVNRERMASPEAIAQLQRCLTYVVDSGLGNKARSEYFSSAGKTGTAQVWEKGGNTNRKLVSFIGYFPADNPRYTMMVTMEGYGLGGGSSSCAPVFRRVSEAIMARYIRPAIATAKDTLHTPLPFVTKGNSAAALRVMEALGLGVDGLWAKANHGHTWGVFSVEKQQLAFTATPTPPDGQMPNVIGMGAKDALWLLERKRLKVRLRGRGMVVAQSLSAGERYQAGQEVVLHLDYGHTTTQAPAEAQIPKSEASQPSDTTRPQATPAPKAKPVEKPKEKPQTASKPTTKPSPKPATKPASKPSTTPKAKPSTQVKPASKPTVKPTTKPATKDKPKKQS